jgi:restriction system protein
MFESFKKHGYSAELTGGGGADGGVDIRLRKVAQLYLVQCKHYKAYKVPVMVVRELYGVMTAQGAAGGFVVTSGRFTPDAYSFAKNTSIKLIDGKKLITMLDPADLPHTQTSNSSETVCPKCGNKLTERPGKYGKFLGCSTYPKCNYTESI